jgi:multicomponent Na+:H+ antiporter subunit C
VIEVAFVALVGLLFTAAVYLMLSRHLIRVLLGVAILGNGVNLVIFTAGRVVRGIPAIIPETADVLSAGAANPLPQALILTAIVISFSFFAFLLVLAYRAFQEIGHDDSEGMRIAEPPGRVLPPMDY